MKNKRTISRRQFLVGAGATIVAGGGLAYVATRQPTINFATANYQAADSGKRVLVAYASQYGSTSEVATAIGEQLHQQGFSVDVLSTFDIQDLTPYQAAIIGAPIQSSAWKPEAVSFVDAQQAALSKIPVAYFATCMELGLSEDTPTLRQKIAGWLDPLIEQVPAVKPKDIGLFAGALDYKKMSYAMQVLYRAFSEDDTDGDYRDWAAIRAWASDVQPKLLAA